MAFFVGVKKHKRSFKGGKQLNYEIFNWTAFLFLFVAYVLLLKGVFTAQNYIYLGMQLVGGTSFVIIGIYVNAWSVWMFNGFWIIATLWALILKVKKKNCKNL